MLARPRSPVIGVGPGFGTLIRILLATRRPRKARATAAAGHPAEQGGATGTPCSCLSTPSTAIVPRTGSGWWGVGTAAAGRRQFTWSTGGGSLRALETSDNSNKGSSGPRSGVEVMGVKQESRRHVLNRDPER